MSGRRCQVDWIGQVWELPGQHRKLVGAGLSRGWRRYEWPLWKAALLLTWGEHLMLTPPPTHTHTRPPPHYLKAFPSAITVQTRKHSLHPGMYIAWKWAQMFAGTRWEMAWRTYQWLLFSPSPLASVKAFLLLPQESCNVMCVCTPSLPNGPLHKSFR